MNKIYITYKFILLLILIFLANIYLNYLVLNPVSPWHDELWNLYPSLQFLGLKNGIWSGCDSNMCIKIFGKEIPVLSGPYHGVIKTIIFSPFVLLDNVSIIRILNLTIFLLPILYLLKQKKYFGSTGIFFIGCSIYLVFPTLMFEAIFDQGQFIIPNCLLIIAGIELVKLNIKFNPNKLLLIIFLSTLAVYEKLTNLPVGLAFSLIAFIILLKNKYFNQSLLAILFSLIFSPYFYFLSKNYSAFDSITSS